MWTHSLETRITSAFLSQNLVDVFGALVDAVPAAPDIELAWTLPKRLWTAENGQAWRKEEEKQTLRSAWITRRRPADSHRP